MASDGTDPAELLERRADDGSAGEPETDDMGRIEAGLFRMFLLVVLVVWGPFGLLFGVKDRWVFAWGVVTTALYIGFFGALHSGAFDPLVAEIWSLAPDISPLIEAGKSAITAQEVWIAVLVVAGIATAIGLVQIHRWILANDEEIASDL